MMIHTVRGIAVGAALIIGALVSNAHSQSMLWEEMDPNHTGVVTAEQYAAYAKAQFDAMDTHHQGKLTKAEWIAGVKSLNAERKQKNETARAAAVQKRADAAAKKAATTSAPAPTPTR